MSATETNTFAREYKLRETREYANYVNGQWVKSGTGKTFENRNPANQDDLIGIFQESDANDLNAAVEAASKAYESWRLTPAPKRAEYLYHAGDILKRRKDETAREMTREMGKVVDETKGDIQEAIDMVSWPRAKGGVSSADQPSNCTTISHAVRMPLACRSHHAVELPLWPFRLEGHGRADLRQYGGLKPASLTPLSVVMLTEAFEEAGLPAGVWNMVTGGGREVGEPMLKNAKIKVISFTASTEVGRGINVACAPQFKHVHLEMGGKNVIMVMDDADVDLAVDGALWGAFGTTGQRCTAASRVVVHDKVYDQFVEKLAARAKKLRVGNGLDKGVDMGPSVSASQLKTVAEYVEDRIDEGAKLRAGGHVLTDGDYGKASSTSRRCSPK